jgi:hypothetical protein
MTRARPAGHQRDRRLRIVVHDDSQSPEAASSACFAYGLRARLDRCLRWKRNSFRGEPASLGDRRRPASSNAMISVWPSGGTNWLVRLHCLHTEDWTEERTSVGVHLNPWLRNSMGRPVGSGHHFDCPVHSSWSIERTTYCGNKPSCIHLSPYIQKSYLTNGHR